MTDQHRTPPRFATWLLHRWVSGPRRESVVGDLVEAYQGGRSNFWYWRQALVVIATGLVHAAVDHPFLVLRGLVVGWLVLMATETLRWRLVYWWLQAPVGTPIVLPVSNTTWILCMLACFVMFGWIVARTHQPHGRAVVTVFASSWAACAIAVTISYAPHQATAPMSWVWRYIARQGSFGGIVLPLCIVLGGLLATSGKSREIDRIGGAA